MGQSMLFNRCNFTIYAIAIALLALSQFIQTDAFAPSHQKPIQSSSLAMAGFLDDVGKFFDGLGNNSDDSSDEQRSNAELVNDIDGAYTGSKRIITIPAKTMKLGGLRLYCNLYLMGVQNTPEKGCWKASQSDNSEVNLRYTDLSGSIIIQFTEDGINVDRLGSSPSMKYLLHESVILNGFLDELNAIVYAGDVGDANRLLTLEESDTIEKARDFVSFA